MSSLQNRQILVGITGGVAAYKSIELVRLLTKAGANVRVVMTKGAQAFITPLTLQAVSSHAVHVDLLDPEAEAGMGHIELARWADLIVVAPASANFIARLTQGQGDDLLTTLCLACKAHIALAPAMNQGMWANPSVQDNIKILRNRGIEMWGPDSGIQACGDVGLGRMIEPQQILEMSSQQFESGLLSGKKVVITAGPTREAIDPVRYISNYSSGKMGYAIAQACVDAGAKVHLVSGPVLLDAPERLECKQVCSALEMRDAVLSEIDDCDIFIASAAVADYRPATLAEQKIKKTADNDQLTIILRKNPDILAEAAVIMRQQNRPGKLIVGFAAESENLLANAQSKLERKGLDMIIANDISRQDIGFNHDDNAVTILNKNNDGDIMQEALEAMSKSQLAKVLINKLANL